MKIKAVSGIMLTLALLTSMLTLAFNIQLIKASDQIIYIRQSGKVEPSNASIKRSGKVYTLTDNINGSIVVEKNDIMIDGAGYTLQGTGAVPSKGISISERSNVVIKNLEIKTFYYGIYLSESSTNTIQGNNITNNFCGIHLEYSSNYNSIYGNNIKSNIMNAYMQCGIYLYMSSENSISDNNLTDNYYGIRLEVSSDNTFRNNSIANNKYNFLVSGGPVSDFVNDVDASNTVDGKPIYYWISKQDMSVPLDAGYVALINCTRITVQNLNLSNNGQGLLLAHTTNSTITKNTVANNQYGINLVFSSNNVISENNVANNTRGVSLGSQGNQNTVSGNNITNNESGISLSSSSDNFISGNNITNNEYGIEFRGSSDNKFYHNTFISNTKQVFDWSWDGHAPDYPQSINIWDDGYPSGGNCWSDYTGVDNNGDGIGDTPYVIDSDNTDRYPLITSFITSEDTTSPTISILSPENKSYPINNVLLTFTVSESTSWIGYSLDGQMNVTITGNTTLSELSDGSHSLIVYTNDTAGNMGYSESVYFSARTGIEPQQAQSILMWIVAAIAIITSIVALVVYFAKFKKII